MARGLPWALACAALSATWTVAAWRTVRADGGAFLRGWIGGVAALALASCGYALLRRAGAEVAWESLAASTWHGAGLALLVGLVEEGAKLVGVAVASPGGAPRRIAAATVAVASLFAVGEAFLTVDGGGWALALGRAALAPVAHGSLAIPLAWALSRTSWRGGAGRAPPRVASTVRILGGLALAAALHGSGDWSLAQGGWGRLGFAATMVAPVLWLYARLAGASGAGAAPTPVRSSVRSSSATPHACAMQPRGV